MTYRQKSPIINPMRLILAMLLLSLPAQAGTVSRLYDFEPGTKAQADQVDAELDNIISTMNGNIDSSNLATGAFGTANIANAAITTIKLADGSVTNAKLVTGSSAYFVNYRKGCTLEASQVAAVTQSMNVKVPCELIVDGVKGSIVVDTPVANLDTGTFANKKAYYVYATPTLAGALTFEISATTPNVGTFRKTGDATKRYIGSTITSASASIGRFKQTGNRYKVYQDGTNPYFDSLYTASSSVTNTLNVPSIATSAIAEYNLDLSGSVAAADYCAQDFFTQDAVSRVNELISVRTTYYNSRSDFRIPLSSKVMKYNNSCTLAASALQGILFKFYGWEEPPELY